MEYLKMRLETFPYKMEFFNYNGLYRYSAGIRFLITETQGYWFLDYIAALFLEEKEFMQNERFIKLRLSVIQEQKEPSILFVVHNSNENIIFTKAIKNKYFPFNSINLSFVDKILFLPCENNEHNDLLYRFCLREDYSQEIIAI